MTFPNTLKFVKNIPMRIATLFSVSGNVVKHGLSCLIYYFSKNKGNHNPEGGLETPVLISIDFDDFSSLFNA